MALSAPLSVRATTPPHFNSIDEYYGTLPDCAVSCEKEYWGVRVNSPTCGGDGTKFSCFCSNSVLASTDLIFTYGDARNACLEKQCPESEANNVDLALIRMAAFCSGITHPGENYIALVVC